MDIKPIETVYNGYRFRSRLEARWAVFFDELGIKYEYEPEGFDLGEHGWYLPDFWLPDVGIWVEIKGGFPLQSEQNKAKRLSICCETPVCVLFGGIPKCNDAYADVDDYMLVFTPTDGDEWEGWTKQAGGHIDMVISNRSTTNVFVECDVCDDPSVMENTYIGMKNEGCPKSENTCQKFRYRHPYRALQAARQARFEHGQVGSPKRWAI